MGSISIAFDVDGVKQKRVKYDPASNTLILKNPSAKLVSDIKQYDNPTPTDGRP